MIFWEPSTLRHEEMVNARRRDVQENIRVQS
jgi:hypothetical protein